MKTAGKPLMLMILDGWGMPTGKLGDAVSLGNLPNFWRLWDTYPHTSIGASGNYVGLPEGQMGDSEVGHMNIGSGRVLYQEVTKINNAIEDGSFFSNPVLLEALNSAKAQDGAVHFIGLLSDGGIHSQISHLLALIRFAAAEKLEKVFIHCFADGRDTNTHSLPIYLKMVEDEIASSGVGEIATIIGRYYAMDRDQNWNRVQRAYGAMVYGNGVHYANPQAGVEASYAENISDEFIEPIVITAEDGSPKGLIKGGDSVVFFNYRSDRAREITRAFTDKDFKFFDRGPKYPKVNYYCMTNYDSLFKLPVAFLSQPPSNTLSKVLSRNGMRQLRIAETEKYAHVTFFFSGGLEKMDVGEDRVMIPSPNVDTYDRLPEMSCSAVTKAVVDRINSGIYDVIILNFANPDMVGHTGNLEATIKALEAVDACIGIIEKEIKEVHGTLIITADHGNVEKMLDEQDKPFTTHTTNLVPLLLIDDSMLNVQLSQGRLEDIAPTILQLLDIRQPPEMTGKSLILTGLNDYTQLSFNF